jgi:peptidoglycan/LPS O-acetylase OafA/YrhL
MARIFGFVVTAIWLVFTFMALSAASQGQAAGQPDVAFWYRAAAFLLGIAALVALVGTLRYRYEGPQK